MRKLGPMLIAAGRGDRRQARSERGSTMSARARCLTLVSLVALIVLAPVAAAPGKPFTVHSTLDGKRVLPRRIHWIAYTSLPQSQLASGGVTFLIDGKVVWFG